MKLHLSLLAFSAINTVLAAGTENTCSKDAELVNQHEGEKYTQEIVCPIAFPLSCRVLFDVYMKLTTNPGRPDSVRNHSRVASW